MSEDTPDLDTVVTDAVDDAAAATPAADTSTSTPEPAASAEAAPPSGFSDDDFKAFGLEGGPVQPGQRENRIPYSRVRAIVENARKKLHRDFESERGKAAESARALEARLQQMDAIGQIMQTDPARFIQMLQQVNPEYARYKLEQAAQAAAEHANGNGRPAPDLDLGNGYRTYSPQGLEQLLDWQAQQLEARLSQRYQPLEDSHRQQQIVSEAGQRVTAQLNDAVTWPGFEQHASEILALLQKDTSDARAQGRRPMLTLDAAYRQVVLPKLMTTREAQRAELMKEIQQAPTSTAAPAAGAAGTAAAGTPRSLDDVVFEAIRARPPR